ncbi:unnamed protein product [Rangifer tarandus platyrhynchus]|uniref:Uncharacterized protein n=3 Tax=Rangifer tarandus platyrhynchus TaxID=3082113 RepID=A0ACB0EZ26_RANTA|nr:unnamed protein product [Rangifer tarandus platyrhynchus]CAI9705714.1 unnamed protein product [Rangifer tarandus platyrhynchus]
MWYPSAFLQMKGTETSRRYEGVVPSSRGIQSLWPFSAFGCADLPGEAPEHHSAPSIPLARILPRARTGLNSGSDISTAQGSLSVWKAGCPGALLRHGSCR